MSKNMTQTTDTDASTENGNGTNTQVTGAADPPTATVSDHALTHDAASTRERILDVALDLFTDQGYDGTSLREIAERLGLTKAALYYHFASKEDILMALHMRLHEFGKEAIASLGDEPVSLEHWAEILDGLVDQMLAQRKLFLMHERNQATFEKVHRDGHEADHEDLQNRFRTILSDPRVTLRDRVRMAASFGVIFSGLVLASDAFTADSNAEMGEELRQCVHNVLLG
jgi:AcrR family transcriptional regulator